MFDNEGKLIERDQGIGGFFTEESWDKEGSYKIKYYNDYREVAKEEYFRIIDRIVEEVETTGIIPDIIRNVIRPFL